MHLRVCVSAVAVALAVLGILTPVDAQTGAPAGTWERVGATGTSTEALSRDTVLNAHILAVAEDWPVGRLMLLEQTRGSTQHSESEKVWSRSLDGGATWSQVALPPNVTRLRLPPAFGGQRLGFAVTTSGLQRSSDNADTWQHVVPSTSTGQLLVSPSFATDGTVVFLADGVASLSVDGGATWSPLAPPTEDSSTSFASLEFSPDFGHDRALFGVVAQQPVIGTLGADGSRNWRAISPGADLPVEALFISPAFAVDHTLLATIATSDSPYEDELTPEDLDPESGTGVVPPAILVSRDGGANWNPAQGLEREGLPYHWHAFVQLSPTFERDHTAFAFAYAPWRHSQNLTYRTLQDVRRALFRSDDGGLTWHSVFNRETLVRTDGGERLVLSPDFAQDHFAMLWSVTDDIIGRGHTCQVSRTVDGGETWEVARQGGTSYLSGDTGCANMIVGGPPGHLAAVMSTFGGNWEALTTVAPAGAGLPRGDAGPPATPVSRENRVILVDSIHVPPSPGGGSTMFAVRGDGSVWILSAAS